MKLKARRSLGSSLYPKHAAVPNTHPSASVGDFNFSIQQSWPEEHDSPKRPRDDNGRGITGSSQPAKVFGRTGGLGLRPNEMSPNNRRGEDPQAPATPAEDLQQTVTLPQLQSLPPLDGIADLPAFAATPYFTPKFISESIGGNIRVGGLVRVGKSRMEDQVVACEEYLAFQSAFNPYLPPAPGQHGVFLDLRHLSGEENKLNQCKILPLFISTATGRWYYSGHYSESIRAEKVKETTQRHFVSAQLLDKWLGSIFATRHALTDLGLEVLMKSNLY